ncbi:MAG TPA: hypothetical protein VFD71_17300 [Planctomycetota bacterium]|nr:hypothetical protein [Planctomycetota bacterium]
MVKKASSNLNAWERLIAWTAENQKVIMVVLLIILAPSFAMTGLFTRSFQADNEAALFTRIRGRSITQGEAQRARIGLEAVPMVLRQASRVFEPMPAPLAAAGAALQPDQDSILDLQTFFMLKMKAHEMGIRVSDTELAQYIHELWQRIEAGKRAADDLAMRPQPKPDDRNAIFQWQMDFMQLTKKKYDDLRGTDGKAFDPDSWAKYVGAFVGHSSLPLPFFEESLRDACAIGKLENYVRGSVVVTPQEALESYQKESQQRKLSWIEFKLPADALAKAAAAVPIANVKSHYELNKDRFKKSPSLRATWLLLPKEHFLEEAKKVVTDDDLKKHYAENRNDYRTSALLATETEFAVRKPEEKTALDTKLYQPFEEVKEKVREKVVETRGQTEMRTFSEKLRQRIFPPKPGADAKAVSDTPAVGFDVLAKEFPFLKTGTTSFVERKDVKDAFGDAYSFAVESWFRLISEKKPIRPATSYQGEKGQIFYTKVDVRPANFLPPLPEIEPQVRQDLAKQEMLESLEKSARTLSENKEGAAKDLDAAAKAGLDLEQSGEKVHVTGSEVHTSLSFVASHGPLLVPKAATPKDEKSKDATDLDEDAAGDNEEEHPAQERILAAAFGLAADTGTTPETVAGKTAVTSDQAVGAVYLLRVDGTKPADPARFEAARPGIERKLWQQNADLHFSAWLKSLRAEMLPPQKPEA